MDAKPSLAVIAFPSSAWERDNKSLMAKKQAEQTFEAALKRLEEVLGSLEHGDLALEDSLAAFEEGVRLVKFCQQKLDEVEKRVELLLKDDAGKFFTRPFPEEEGEGN
jgi:exodeoxyribonuclease VII small subunit